MKQRVLGGNGPEVSALGLGCMGMSEFYGAGNDTESVCVIHRAIALGTTLFDTADMYGCGHNEELLGRAVASCRSRVFIATKFGNVRASDGTFLGVNGRPDYVRAACEASLRRLGVETIDLYYQHRVDPEVPIEDTVGAMAELVAAGKVRHLGLSEAAPDTLRHACHIHPIAALQTEYSLWTRDVETNDVLATCRELGISFVAYSPLGRGFLSGRFRSPDELPEGDWRRNSPRFQGENFTANLRLADAVQALAKARSCTASQIALAWVLSRGEDVVPIPGTKRMEFLEQNAAAADIELTQDELHRLDEALPPGAAAGTRYPEQSMRFLNGQTPPR